MSNHPGMVILPGSMEMQLKFDAISTDGELQIMLFKPLLRSAGSTRKWYSIIALVQAAFQEFTILCPEVAQAMDLDTLLPKLVRAVSPTECIAILNLVIWEEAVRTLRDS